MYKKSKLVERNELLNECLAMTKGGSENWKILNILKSLNFKNKLDQYDVSLALKNFDASNMLPQTHLAIVTRLNKVSTLCRPKIEQTQSTTEAILLGMKIEKFDTVPESPKPGQKNKIRKNSVKL